MIGKKQLRSVGKGLVQVYNFIKKQAVPSNKVDSSKGIIVWEINQGANDFPQQLLQKVSNSPVGSAALDLWNEYTEGQGMVDPKVANLQVNANETFNALHSKESADISSMWGCAILVSYKLSGQKSSFKHLPFESTRLGESTENGVISKIFYNPYYGMAEYDSKFTKWYYAYNPDPEFVKKQILEHNKLKAEKKVNIPYPGQVYWFSIEKPNARIYPQPFYYSAVSWLECDASIQKYHARNIENNFMQSMLINKQGNPDTPAGEVDDDGNFVSTVGEVFDEQMQSFAGADNAGTVMVNWFMREEEKAEILPFPTNINDATFINLQKEATDQLAIGFKTPRVLLGIATSGKLGDTNEVLNAVLVMMERTSRMRERLEEIYHTVFDGFNGINKDTNLAIKSVNPMNILPDWVVTELSPDERRKYIEENYNIVFDPTGTRIQTQE